jgi:hypothetical protein
VALPRHHHRRAHAPAPQPAPLPRGARPTDDASWLEALPGRAPSGEATAPPASSARGPAASIAWAHRYGEVFALRYGLGFTETEIARATGLSLAAVKTRAHRAKLAARSACADVDAPCPLAHGDGQGPGIQAALAGTAVALLVGARRRGGPDGAPTFLLPVLAALATPARPASPPSVVAAYLAPGAVVFDLDRGEQLDGGARR